MNPVDHQESTCKDDDEKVVASSSSETEIETEPGHLLDESWFFGNLLIHTKPRMSRCYSDPSPSSSSSSVNYSTEHMMMQPPGKSLEETFSLLQKLPAAAEENSAALVRAPSLPEESSSSSSSLSSSAAGGRRKRSQRRLLLQRGNSYSTTTPPTPPPIPVSSANNLLSRAPSLPSSIGRRREEIQDDESDFSMSRLIRQASLKQSDPLPRRNPPVPIPKLHQGVIQQGAAAAAATTTSSRPRKPETERSIPENPEGMIKRQHPVLTGGNKLTKSSSDLVFQELQGLSIKFDKTDVQSGPNTNRDGGHKIPNTQGGVEEKYSMRRRSQLQKQLSMDTGNSNNNNNNNKSVEDMKAQIKFWARAVASNVRQEC